MRAIAPGKIIIAGEHSVAYGSQAMAVAVNTYAKVHAVYQELPVVSLHLDNYHKKVIVPISEIENIRLGIDENYQHYLLGSSSIDQVLPYEGALYLYAISSFYNTYDVSRKHGVKLHLNSSIPVRAGMGSSAATVAAVLNAVSSFFDIKLDKESLFRFTGHTERLQHGCVSVIDPLVTVYGGLVSVDNGEKIQKIDFDTSELFIVNTGEPEVSTGECVTHVKKEFGTSSIWQDFISIMGRLEHALIGNDIKKLRDCLKCNHKLLVDIGVVPEKVQKFISDLATRRNAIAKISGAGAVKGDKAGFVLVHAQESVEDICLEYGFAFQKLCPDYLGCRIGN